MPLPTPPRVFPSLRMVWHPRKRSSLVTGMIERREEANRRDHGGERKRARRKGGRGEGGRGGRRREREMINSYLALCAASRLSPRLKASQSYGARVAVGPTFTNHVLKSTLLKLNNNNNNNFLRRYSYPFPRLYAPLLSSNSYYLPSSPPFSPPF